MRATWRSRAHDLLAEHGPPSVARRVATLIVLLAVGAAAASGMFDTLPDLPSAGRAAVRWSGAAATLVFVLEYLLRLWTAPARDPAARDRPAAARLGYALSFLGLADLLVALPGALALAGLVDGIVGDLAALLALVKLARYVPGLSLVAAVFH